MVCLAGASGGSVLPSSADSSTRHDFLSPDFTLLLGTYAHTMSTWGVGDDHDSEEVRTLKEQIRLKGNFPVSNSVPGSLTQTSSDAANATLHGEVMKREAELKEVKDSMTEVLIKVRWGTHPHHYLS